MSYVNKSTLAQSPTFRARVLAAIAEVAGEVTQETGKPASQAAKRLDLAMEILRDPAVRVQSFIWPVLFNPVIGDAGEDAGDSDIKYQVSVVWDIVAGVTSGDKG